MLVCSVSVSARRTVATDIVEVAAASDTTKPEGGVFVALVDEPISAIDSANAYLGEIMEEAANAVDSVEALGSVYDIAVDETAIAVDAPDAAVPSGTSRSGMVAGVYVNSSGTLRQANVDGVMVNL
jgi:hypothetical protein